MMKNEDFKKVIGNILVNSHNELMSKSEEQLEEYWFFNFDKGLDNLDWYCYEFFKTLELYVSFCREWEEEKNGSICVVERVREKYIFPKIKLFLEKLKLCE